MKKTILSLAMIALFAINITSCKPEKNEDAGDKIEEAADDVEDAAEDAADGVEDAAEDAADGVEDAAEDVKSEM